MKKIYTLLTAALVMGSGLMAQNRMLLIEEGTQASCPPCATQNPAFDELLEENDDKVVVLKYQTSWPGFDQMNLDNPVEVADRVAYYGFNGVPTAFMNGELWANDCGAWEGAPACLDQAEIDAAHALAAPVDMDISGEVVNGVLVVSGSITALEDVSGDLKLRIALTEQRITSEDAPGGTNGETEYFNVLKRFIGGSAGITLADMTAGDVYTIDEMLPLGGEVIYNFDQLGLVAFVQDDADQSVHQAAKDLDIPLTAEFENSASGAEISGISASFCLGSVTESPVFTIVNQGNTELTSATITYSVNGGAEQTYDWTGSLALLATEDVTLDPITFEAILNNTFTASISMPNGVAEEGSTDDDAIAIDVAGALSTGEINVEIVLDNYGSETTWEIRNEAGVAVLTGGPYADDNNGQVNTDSYQIPAGADGCYEFFIADAYGDGICCAYGLGSYTLTSSDGTVVVQGGEFADDDSKSFTGTSLVSLEEATFDAFVAVGPNPAQDLLNVMVNANTNDVYNADLINALGQKVFSTVITDGAMKSINVSSFETGIYQLMISNGQGTSVKKVSITR